MGKEIFTLGIDGNPDMLADIKNGVTTSTRYTDTVGMGASIIRTIKAYLDGEEVPQSVKAATFVVNASNVDEYMTD